MKLSELNPRQTQLLRHFHVIMEGEGWEDYRGIETLMDGGECSIPEAERVWENTSSIVTLQVHIPLNMFRVMVENKLTSERSLWLFFYRCQTNPLLRWFATNPQAFGEGDMQAVIDATLDQADYILYQDSDLYEIKARKGKGFLVELLSIDLQTDAPIHA